jgi:uncharacterized protein YjbI with pentapeptide repeats
MPRNSILQPLPQDLRNCSFRKMNCEGWDFAGRDIRGCDFRNTRLNGASFRGTIAGRSQRQNRGCFKAILTCSLAGSIIGFLGVSLVGDAFMEQLVSSQNPEISFPLVPGLIIFAFIGNFAMLGAGAGAGLLISCYFSLESVRVLPAISGEFGVINTIIFTAILSFLMTCLRGIEAFWQWQFVAGFFWSVFSLICLIVILGSFVIVFKTFREMVGTNFGGSNLIDVDFSHARLDSCKFDNADVSFINWSHVQGDRSTIDFTDTLMQLLISRNGKNGKYLDLDLSDQNLVKVELQHANLNGADLTRSNLQDARLDYTNLSNVKAGGTDLRRATLTGACIQNWTVNNDTQFDDLVCDYIYLTSDRAREDRRPLSGSFEPGDFEKLVDKFADTLDFILRRGTDPIAFRESLNQFTQDNPEARIKAIMDLDADRVLVQATVPEGSDKVRIHEEFNFKLQLKEQEIRSLNGTVKDRDKIISMMNRLLHKPQPTIQVLQANNPTGPLMPNDHVYGGDNITAGNNNQGVVGKDMTGVAGRDITGTLNLNLNTLRETEDPKAKELVNLIDQLKQAIESPDCDLDDRYKKRAIEYLDNLAQLAKDKPEDFLKGAKDNLDDLADIADKGSKLATFAEKHLPTFMTAIGALRLWFGV